MTRSFKPLLLVAQLAAAAAFAQPAPPPPPAAPPAPALSKAAKAPKAEKVRKISLQYSGRLGDALKKIAEKGGINLILTGQLNSPAEVYLTDVSAEEALAIVAKSHQLHVTREGSIWTVRPMGDEEAETFREAEQERAEAERELAEAQREAAEAHREAILEAQEAAREAAEAAGGAVIAGRDPAELQERIDRRVRERLTRVERRANRISGGRDVGGYGPVVVREGETVQNAVSYGGPLEVYGHVEADAVSFGGPVKLGPKAVVEGDVVAFGGPIEKAEGAVVEGDEIAMSGATAGATMARSFRGFTPSERFEDFDDSERSNDDGNDFPMPFLFFVALFSVGFLSMMFAPNSLKVLAAELRSSPVRCGVTGLISVPAVGVLSGLLIATVIGILVVIPLWIVLGVGSAMGLAAIANEIGNRVPVPFLRKTQALVLAVGLIILLVAAQIPYFGAFTMVVMSLLSLGAVVRALLAHRRRGMGTPQPV